MGVRVEGGVGVGVRVGVGVGVGVGGAGDALLQCLVSVHMMILPFLVWDC